MKKILLAAIAIMSIGFSVLAQEAPKEKMNVLIDYFDRPSSVPFKYAETARNAVMEALHQSNRINLIDVDTQSILKIEESRRMEGVSAGGDMERLALMEQQGANLLIQGVVNDIAISENVLTDSKGQKTTTYDATFLITLKVVNPKDGKIIETATIKAPGGLFDLQGFTIVAHTPDEAVAGYSKLIPGKMKKFIAAAFPIIGNVLEASDKKGDEIKTFYVDLGDANGAKKSQKYDIRELREIAGKMSRKTIGEAEVQDVEGDDISLFKVKKGGKELGAALKSGNKVIVTSKE